MISTESTVVCQRLGCDRCRLCRNQNPVQEAETQDRNRSAEDDAASKKVTLKLSSSLAAYSWYQVAVKGGTSGAKDLAGNALAAERSGTSAPDPPKRSR